MTRRSRAAAVLAASALVVATSTGVASAQSEAMGEIGAEAVTSVTGSLPEELGSVAITPGGENGSVDTSGSLIGEPTSGSLAGPTSTFVGSVNDATGSDAVNPEPGIGSVDTSGSLLGEPTSGSLAPVWGPIGNALGSGESQTIELGSSGTDSLGPVLIVGGVAAVIAAGVAFAPQIEQALADAGVELPPLPGV